MRCLLAVVFFFTLADTSIAQAVDSLVPIQEPALEISTVPAPEAAAPKTDSKQPIVPEDGEEILEIRKAKIPEKKVTTKAPQKAVAKTALVKSEEKPADNQKGLLENPLEFALVSLSFVAVVVLVAIMGEKN